MSKINFEIEDAEIVSETPDSQFATAKLKLFSSGANRHDMICSEETLKKTAPTAYEKPIIFEIKYGGDFGSHNENTTVPAGFIVKDSAEFERQPDGRLSLVVLGKIWKMYSGKFIDVFKNKNTDTAKVSVEMELLDFEQVSNYLTEMKDFSYCAACILGDMVTEASPGANIKMLSFSYEEAYKKEFSDSNIITFPYKSAKDMNPALRGIEPPISVEQGNKIAKQADAIGADKGGWGIAISHFKRTHRIKNGKWVKIEKGDDMEKDSMKEELSVEEDIEKKEEMATETPAEEKAEDPKEEAKETPAEEKEEHKEERKEDDNEDKEDMSMDSNLDVAACLAMLDNETDEYASLVEQHNAGKVNYAKLCNSMYQKMCNMKASMEKMSEENQTYMSENKELKEFKAQTEAKEYSFEVEKVLNEVSETMPKDKVEEAREDSKNFSLDSVDSWKNKTKAIAFSYVKDSKKISDGFVRTALPFAGRDEKVNSSPWKK